jgi:PAS domain S-box-containing protein
VRKVLRTGAVVGLANHTVLRTNQGEEIPIDDSAAPIRDASGQLRGIVLIFRDITARRQAEATSLRLAAIVASSDDAILSKSLDGVVTSWNGGAERLYGYRAEEMIGQPILRLLPEDRYEEEYAILERLRRGEHVAPFETVRQAKDGRLLDVSVTISPLRDARGRIIGASKITRDITDRKRAEEAVRRAKEAAEAADRLKSEFLSTMSHELRTPLHVILGYTDMLLDGAVGDLPSQQMDIVRRIERNSRVLFDLITMVLDLNRLETGGLPVDVRSVQAAALLSEVQAELQGLCGQSGLACTWRVAPGLPPFHTDPGKLKVVLKNLVSNAVKFTEAGSVTVAAEEQQGGIEFSVTDTGIGIPAEAQAYIFEPFRQGDGATARAYGGSGLGLHIVRRLLEVLGGRIRVESVVGQGSTFRVWLPMAYTPQA